MKKLLLASASVLISVTAHAADYPVKTAAVPAVTCAPQNCSGFYAGFGLMGEGSNVDIIGGGLNSSVFSAGGILKLQGGYQLWNGSFLAGVEGGIGYEFTTPNSAAIAISPKFTSRFVGTELVKLGYNFFPASTTATTVPSQSPLPLIVPANLLAASTPYLTFGGLQRNGKSLWVNGAGVDTVISAGWTSSAKYLYAPAQSGMPATNMITLELNKHF